MSMSRKPFGSLKRGGLKKPVVQELENNQGNAQQRIENQQPKEQIVSKTPVFSLGGKKGKLGSNHSKNIYEKIKPGENGENNETSEAPKISLGPNMKLNRQRGLGPKSAKPPMQPNLIEESIEHLDVPKVIPLFRGKGRFGKKNASLEKSRDKSQERVIVEDKEQVDRYDGSYEESRPELTSMQMRPDLKTKHKVQKTESENYKDPSQEGSQADYDQSRNDSQYQYADRNDHNGGVYVPIQATQINLKPAAHQISEGRIQKQNIRTKDLKELLNLEIDLFEDLLSISEITKYEVYISKIKSGTLKNSMDQAFDDKTNQAVQTLPFDFEDFANQCPQDYQTNINMIVQTDQTEALNSFILKIAPVVQQLIRPSSSVVMPPIFLLAFRPNFKKFVTCPHPVFIYETDTLGIVVIGEKLYIATGKVNTVLSIGHYLIGGLESGRVVVWGGRNDKNSRLYQQIFETIQSTNFQLPEYGNDDLQRNSIYSSEGKLISFTKINNQQFYSLDDHGKMVQWKIQETATKAISLKGVKSIDFGFLIEKRSLIAYSVKSRLSNLYIATSRGIIVYNGEQVIQRLENEVADIIDFELPKRSNFVYVIYTDKSFCVYDQHYSKQLFSLQVGCESSLKRIIIPEIEHQNRQISVLSTVYVTDSSGNAYELDLLQNMVEPSSSISSQNQQRRDTIYQGINGFYDRLEVVTLWNDLRCTTTIHKMSVNLEKTVPNLKKIIESNRQVHNLLQMNYAIM